MRIAHAGAGFVLPQPSLTSSRLANLNESPTRALNGQHDTLRGPVDVDEDGLRDLCERAALHKYDAVRRQPGKLVCDGRQGLRAFAVKAEPLAEYVLVERWQSGQRLIDPLCQERRWLDALETSEITDEAVRRIT